MARKQHNIHYIYKTTCNITGRYYIGMHSTSNMGDGYMGSGDRLRRSIRKYGKENHTKEVLEFCSSREELSQREREIITEEHLCNEDCMNMMSGGTGGFISIEQQHRRSLAGGKALAKKLISNEKYFKVHAERSSQTLKSLHKSGKLKYGYQFLGRKHTEESKKKIGEKMSMLQSGSNHSQFGTCWITKDTVNKKIKKEELSSYISSGWIKGRV